MQLAHAWPDHFTDNPGNVWKVTTATSQKKFLCLWWQQWLPCSGYKSCKIIWWASPQVMLSYVITKQNLFDLFKVHMLLSATMVTFMTNHLLQWGRDCQAQHHLAETWESQPPCEKCFRGNWVEATVSGLVFKKMFIHVLTMVLVVHGVIGALRSTETYLVISLLWTRLSPLCMITMGRRLVHEQ